MKINDNHVVGCTCTQTTLGCSDQPIKLQMGDFFIVLKCEFKFTNLFVLLIINFSNDTATKTVLNRTKEKLRKNVFHVYNFIVTIQVDHQSHHAMLHMY